MQPENNAQENSEESRLGNAVKEVTAVEAKPVAAEPVKKDNMFENTPKKSGKGMVFGLILCAILAVGGIGFGVWEMMDGETQKSGLNEQINALKTQNNELQEKLSTTTTVDTDTDGEVLNTTDYIYVGEWGLKIKIPEGLSTVSYEFSYGSGNTKIAVWGVDCSKGGCQAFPEFADVNKNSSMSLGSVSRFSKGTELSPASAPTLVFSDDEYDYYYYHPQAVYSMNEDEKELEASSTVMIKEMLSNKDNYSKI